MSLQAWNLLATVIVGLLTIVAIIIGPMMALRIQRALDEKRDARNRKLTVFKTLMSFRATRISPLFVQALNLIDVEFTSASEKDVRDAWRECQDHYSEWGRQTAEQKRQQAQANLDRAEDLLANLLVKMGRTLGYHFDKVFVKKGWYHPEGLANIEQERLELTKRWLAVLSGQARVPVAVFEQTFEDLAPRQTEPAQVRGDVPKTPV